MAKACRAVAVVAVASAAFAAPAFAEFSLSGYWDEVMAEDLEARGPGPALGDYLGIPINDAARLRGDTWNASYQELPERQCVPHNSFYGWHAIGAARIWETTDLDTQKIIKLNTFILWNGLREIWMDGRPHPPETAPHTWQGFSTGRWEGDVLVVRTTHLKSGHITRNGIVFSDKAVMEERFFVHGDFLNHVQMLTDPVYLTEPFVRTDLLIRRPKTLLVHLPCRPSVEVPREKGVVPHNDFHDTSGSVAFARKFNLPLAAVRGGAETALPEFMDSPAAKVLAGTDQPAAKK